MQLRLALSPKRLTESTSRTLSRRSSSPHMKSPSNNQEYEEPVQSEGSSNTKGKHRNSKSFLVCFGDWNSWASRRGDKDKRKKDERTKNEDHDTEKEAGKQKKKKKKKREGEKVKGKEHGKNKGNQIGEESQEEKEARKTRKGVVSKRALRVLQEGQLGETASTNGKSVSEDEVAKQVQDYLESQQMVWAGKQSSKQTAPQGHDLVGALERAVYKAFVEGRFAHQTLYWPEEGDNKDCRQCGSTESTAVATSDSFSDSNSSKVELDHRRLFSKTSVREPRGIPESKDVISL